MKQSVKVSFLIMSYYYKNLHEKKPQMRGRYVKSLQYFQYIGITANISLLDKS